MSLGVLMYIWRGAGHRADARAVAYRQGLVTDQAALTHTPYEWIFEIKNFKKAKEKVIRVQKIHHIIVITFLI